MKRPLLVPSKAFKQWQRGCKESLRAAGDAVVAAGYGVIDFPINCRAWIYREALRGDAVGF